MATITKSLTIESQGTYNLTFDLWSYSEWAASAGITTSYASLAALIADEKAVRQLMTVHASVDYLANCPDSSTISTIINNNLCAKWINLRDYAFDKLSAKSNIKSVMDAADKYGYGEWGKINSTTWGALGNVPIMTANNAPYGVASAQSEHSKYKAYGAIDGSSSSTSFYCSNTSVTKDVPVTEWWQYQSVNPIILKRIFIQTPPTNGTWDYYVSKLVVKGSNDGITFDDLATFTDLGSCQVGKYLDIPNPNDDAYLYIRYLITESSSYNGNTSLPAIGETQFYGRELKPLVPIMTDNTHPKGVAGATSTQGAYYPYFVFNGRNTASQWWHSAWQASSTPCEQRIFYDFEKDVCIKKFVIANYSPTDRDYPTSSTTVKLTYSNNGTTWTDIGDAVTLPMNGSYVYGLFNNNEVTARYWGVRFVNYNRSWTAQGKKACTATSLQFYGPDYSEKEFATGSTRKTIYDHGVELVTIETKTIGTGAVATKEPNQLYISVPSSAGVQAVIGGQADFSSYSSLIAKVGNKFKGDSAFGYFVNLPVSSVTPPTGYVVVSNTNSVVSSIYPTLDISSVNGTNHAMLNAGHNAGGTFKESTITELWLE